MGRVVSHLPRVFKRRNEILRQMQRVGWDSMLLIGITSGFTGLVTAVQASYQTSGYIPDSLIGVLVGKSTMIELAPVLTALVLSGRVGASMAAEIGTMKVSEQIDALETMAIDPVDFLYLPRILAGMVMVPLLTVFANLVGILSAFVISHFHYGLNVYSFFFNMRDYFEPSDLWGGLVKAVFFGIIITSIGCYIGLHTRDGAEGVGRSATLTVVYSSILVLLMDFVVASVLFGSFS
ncbi:MAG: ABC transporter permease [Candidatus Cloacimonetes bacterium]|nr:ABC transporter permease [Candidatus Cloacimonadota bacterium]